MYVQHRAYTETYESESWGSTLCRQVRVHTHFNLFISQGDTAMARREDTQWATMTGFWDHKPIDLLFGVTQDED